MAIKAKVDFSKLEKAIALLPKETATHLRQGIKQAATMIQSEAVANSGYVTRSGNLNRRVKDPENVSVADSGLSGRIRLANTNIVPYAIIQHEGGRGIPPKKFLTRAVETKRNAVNKIFERAIKNAIKGAGL